MCMLSRIQLADLYGEATLNHQLVSAKKKEKIGAETFTTGAQPLQLCLTSSDTGKGIQMFFTEQKTETRKRGSIRETRLSLHPRHDGCHLRRHAQHF